MSTLTTLSGNGTCYRCGDTATSYDDPDNPGQQILLCDGCHMRMTDQLERKQRIREGKCVECGQEPPAASTSRKCHTCLDERRQLIEDQLFDHLGGLCHNDDEHWDITVTYAGDVETRADPTAMNQSGGSLDPEERVHDKTLDGEKADDPYAALRRELLGYYCERQALEPCPTCGDKPAGECSAVCRQAAWYHHQFGSGCQCSRLPF